MSIYFESESGETLWNPSNDVGFLFIDQVRMIEKLLSFDSGIHFSEGDTLVIDKYQYQLFVSHFVTYICRTNNEPLKLLLSGCVSIIISIAMKLNVASENSNETISDLVAKAIQIKNKLNA